jgi:hypothetical protein
MKIFTLLGLSLFLSTQSLDATSSGFIKLGSELYKEYQAHLRVERNWGKKGDLIMGTAYSSYVQGVLDANNEIDHPKDVTLGQIYAIVGKFLVNNPELLHNNAALLIETAIKRAF